MLVQEGFPCPLAGMFECPKYFVKVSNLTCRGDTAMSSEVQQPVHLLELNFGENRDVSLQPRFSTSEKTRAL